MVKATKKWWPVFVLPTFVAFIIGFVVPFFWGLYLSVSKFTTVDKTTFVCFENYLKVYSIDDDKQTWFEKLKTCASECGFVDMKTYKADPESFKGNPGEVSTVIRMAVTGRTNTPDLCGIMKALGEVALKRIEAATKYYQG